VSSRNGAYLEHNRPLARFESRTRTAERQFVAFRSEAALADNVAAVTDSRAVSTSPNPYSAKNRRLVYLSDVCVIAVAGILAAKLGTGWSWWLFAWGAALGVLGIAANELLATIAGRIVRANSSDLERLRSRRRDQRLMVFPGALAMGCSAGIIAAGLQSAVPDVLLTVGIVVFEVGLPLALTPWILRRVAAKSANQRPGTLP
jgi:hypothetical protein